MSTTKIKLNKNRKFHLGNIESARYKGFDDSEWEDVILPHDWSVTLTIKVSAIKKEFILR